MTSADWDLVFLLREENEASCRDRGGLELGLERSIDLRLGENGLFEWNYFVSLHDLHG